MLDNHERRILDETERQLAQDDPVLDAHFRSHTQPVSPARPMRLRWHPGLPTWVALSILIAVAAVLLALPAAVGTPPPTAPAVACGAGTDHCPPAPPASKTTDARPMGAVGVP